MFYIRMLSLYCIHFHFIHCTLYILTCLNGCTAIPQMSYVEILDEAMAMNDPIAEENVVRVFAFLDKDRTGTAALASRLTLHFCPDEMHGC